MIKALSVLSMIHLWTQQCLSQDIIRSDHDKFRHNITTSDVNNANCSQAAVSHYCTCEAGHNTFIFNEGSSTGSCLDDQTLAREQSVCHPGASFKFLALISECGDLPCPNQYNISATSWASLAFCQISWQASSYSINGYTWIDFTTKQHEFSLRDSSFRRQKILEITDRASVLSKWSGHLIRLTIDCQLTTNPAAFIKGYCVLLKIQNFPNIATSTVSPTTVTTPSSNASPVPSRTPGENTLFSTTQLITSQKSTPASVPSVDKKRDSGRDEQNDSDSTSILPIVISAVVVLVLVLVVIGIVLYRRRKRTTSKQDDVHLYAGSILPSTSINGTLQHGEKQHNQNTYEEPGTTVNQPVYDYIADESSTQNSGKPSKNSNSDAYGYATPDDISKRPERSQSRAMNGGEAATSGTGYSGEGPLYHTLEDDRGMKQDSNVVDETLDQEKQTEPFYSVLKDFQK